MNAETLLSRTDRKRISEIVRVEVRLALRDIFFAEACLRLGDAEIPLPHGMVAPVIDNDWVYEEPLS